ncbi:cupin domain-containing protein [Sulfuricurvum sp.]|uniref:cupin domain-containing protein n=1 Tax=Sulfuricurvum sp. TaxID=2025608 RepID=UPI003567A8F6
MNIYEIEEPERGKETFLLLHQTPTLKIEAIRSRLSVAGVIYDQNEDEWVVLVRGSATMEIQGVKHALKEGDSVFLARHTRHQVLSTSDDAVWIGVFSF